MYIICWFEAWVCGDKSMNRKIIRFDKHHHGVKPNGAIDSEKGLFLLSFDVLVLLL